MTYDFSTAEKAQHDLIPDKTLACLRFEVLAGDINTPENAFVVTKTDLYQLVLEATVVEGEFAKRKVWHRLTMGAVPGVEMSEGQKKGVAISGAFIRSLLEAGRGIAPSDESAAAIQARKMQSLFEINGMEVWCEIGIEKGSGTYSDKNRINKVVNALATAGKAGATAPLAAPQRVAAPPPQSPPARAARPSWAQGS